MRYLLIKKIAKTIRRRTPYSVRTVSKIRKDLGVEFN